MDSFVWTTDYLLGWRLALHPPLPAAQLPAAALDSHGWSLPSVSQPRLKRAKVILR